MRTRSEKASEYLKKLTRVYVHMKINNDDECYEEYMHICGLVAKYLLAIVKPELMKPYIESFCWNGFEDNPEDDTHFTMVEEVLYCKLEWMIEDPILMNDMHIKILKVVQKFISDIGIERKAAGENDGK